MCSFVPAGSDEMNRRLDPFHGCCSPLVIYVVVTVVEVVVGVVVDS